MPCCRSCGYMRSHPVWSVRGCCSAHNGAHRGAIRWYRPEQMMLPVTLSIYIARQFAGAVVGMLLALAGLVAMFDFIELLRRSISKPDATFAVVAQIAGLRLPYIAMQVLPFAVLLGGMLCFWRL